MDAYISDLEDAFGKAFPQGVLHVFGHLCDGNLHLFLTPRSPSGNPHEIRRLADESVYQTLARHHGAVRSEEHTSELQSLMRISYAVFCLNKKNDASP